MKQKLIDLSISELHFVCVRLTERLRKAANKPDFDLMEEEEKRFKIVQAELDNRILNLFQ